MAGTPPLAKVAGLVVDSLNLLLPEPVSDAYAVPDVDPAEIAFMLQTAMENATYSTEGLSGPFEDGRFVLDSVGDAGCRIETRIVPQGSLVHVTVRYGAACPAA